MLVCIKCRQGLMDPVKSENEPEYTDRYQCGHCSHVATIPSILIIMSQLVCVLLGSTITLYLLFNHTGAALSAWQLQHNQGLFAEILFSLLALVMMLGFAFTFYRALANLRLRHRYLNADR